MRKLVLFCLLLQTVCLPAAAQVSGRQFAEFRAEADAFNRQDPFANIYRAGHYNGYLAGIVDALQGRTLCFKACPCEIDQLVAAHLSRHPDVADRPAAEWLIPLLEITYPCAR